MPESNAALSAREEAAEQARGELADAIALLQTRLTPAHILSDIGQSARSAAAPLIDPLLAHGRSSAGLIGLAGTAVAVVFGLGRASRASQAREMPPAPNHSRAGAGKTADAAAYEARRPSAPPRARQKINTLLLAAGALAAGSAIGAALPLSRAEKQFGEAPGRELRKRARALARDHSSEIMGRAVNAFGVANGIGSALGLLALVASQLNKKSAESRPGDPSPAE